MSQPTTSSRLLPVLLVLGGIALAATLTELRAAVDTAVRQPGVDPDRVVLWGVSLSGGHVIRLAVKNDSTTNMGGGKISARKS